MAHSISRVSQVDFALDNECRISESHNVHLAKSGRVLAFSHWSQAVSQSGPCCCFLIPAIKHGLTVIPPTASSLCTYRIIPPLRVRLVQPANIAPLCPPSRRRVAAIADALALPHLVGSSCRSRSDCKIAVLPSWRNHGCHLVLLTQRPTKSAISPTIPRWLNRRAGRTLGKFAAGSIPYHRISGRPARAPCPREAAPSYGDITAFAAGASVAIWVRFVAQAEGTPGRVVPATSLCLRRVVVSWPASLGGRACMTAWLRT